ncbi:MFS transporter [Chitinophaga sedimenti]|uniref:MFS transporter n=1 Tax=Chitinophaga sedimenti TaxID=2033606 RepID=UPI0020045BBA|nr:MFS transporter [Chitinophaga sedimenti]MCK7554564.1 MFS transporter [Chitinophaga sedimenti]
MLNKTIALYRGAYGGLSPSSWLLSLVLFINRCGNMVIPFMTVYLTQSLHFSLADAGLVMACFGLGAILGAYIGGKLTDSIGFDKVQFWSLLLNGGFFILGQMQSLHGFMICIFCMSAVGEAFRPANAAAIVHYAHDNDRTRAYSLNRLAVNLGFAIGPAIGGILASFSYQLLFWVDGCTCILAAFLIRFLLDPSKANKPTVHQQVGPLTDGTSAYRDRLYIVFIFLSLINAMCFFQMFTIVPVYFSEVMHMSKFSIGVCMGLNGLIIAAIEMLLIFKIEGRRHSLVFIGYGLLLEAICFLGFVLMPKAVWVAFIFMGAITFGEILTLPFMNAFWTSRCGPRNRGQYAALYTMSYSGAHILAPTVGARMVQWTGFTNWWLIVSVLCLLTFAGFRWLYSKVTEETNNAQNPLHNSL